MSVHLITAFDRFCKMMDFRSRARMILSQMFYKIPYRDVTSYRNQKHILSFFLNPPEITEYQLKCKTDNVRIKVFTRMCLLWQLQHSPTTSKTILLIVGLIFKIEIEVIPLLRVFRVPKLGSCSFIIVWSSVWNEESGLSEEFTTFDLDLFMLFGLYGSCKIWLEIRKKSRKELKSPDDN